MKTMAMMSMPALSNTPMLLSDVENPPVAMVVIAWAMASKPGMPASQ